MIISDFMRQEHKEHLDSSPKVIACDFDGTLCEDRWPEIGAPNKEIINYLRIEQVKGNKLILWTCRTGDALDKAVQWCINQGLVFEAINENLPEHIEGYESDSRKVFAHEYIDDKANTTFFSNKGWISVSERLPEKSKYNWVLVQYKIEPEGRYGVPHIAELRNGTWYDQKYYGPLEETIGVKVTHWMPLPGFPKDK